jgi:hypothetical protein
MTNPNPQNKFQKGNKVAGRKAGQPNLVTRDIKTLIRGAAEAVGFIERIAILDAEGAPTGRYEMRYGKDGEAGYLKWLAVNHSGYFSALYGRLMPTELNQKVETSVRPVVRYETAAERRQAMIDKGWSPDVLDAMEEAMEPKFLRDLRAEKAKQAIDGC